MDMSKIWRNISDFFVFTERRLFFAIVRIRIAYTFGDVRRSLNDEY